MKLNLKQKLKKTRESFKTTLENILVSGKSREEILDELIEALILADVGFETAEKIILAVRTSSRKTESISEIKEILKEEIINIIRSPGDPELRIPDKAVIMFVGVNGGGKTTSVAKTARMFQSQGKKVLLVAADTFRAAAQEQLSIWSRRLNIPVIKGQYGADPASVVFDAMQSFTAKEFDVILIDTAGRIHTNVNLMNELEKIKRIIAKQVDGAPHEILLVLDASIGQNALVQAREFLKFSGITGIFLTKLDGTAKGGSVIGIAEELRLPIKFIGVGEGENDVMSFSPAEFADAILS